MTVPTLRLPILRLRLPMACMVLSAICLGAWAQVPGPARGGLPGELVRSVTTAVDADAARLVDVYKDLHRHPELGFMEERTAAIVAKELRALGYEVKTGIGKTGVVGILRNGAGPTVMYRADMDAVAVEEATGLPYASKARVKLADGSETPVSHMCGHDAHTTWMLSVARTMATHKAHWSGTLVVVAQPAEEPIEGAVAMVKDGLYEKHGVPKPQHLIALHTAPLPTGAVVSSLGLLQAGTEQLDVTFHGVGGHGSSPQFTKDPILMGAHAVMSFQAIISRALDPRDMGVITVGAFNAGIINNVIPQDATLKLNFRFFKESVREQMFKGVQSISNGIARTYGMPEDRMPTIVRKGFSTPLVNDDAQTRRLNMALTQSGVVKASNLVEQFPPVTGSEDMHMLAQGLEGAAVTYVVIGSAAPRLVTEARAKGREFPFSNHQPEYQVDLDAIPYGAKVGAIMALELLARGAR